MNSKASAKSSLDLAPPTFVLFWDQITPIYFEEGRNTEMKIQTTTLWTIEKDGVSVDLTLEDIAELLQDMIIMENLILFDSESGRCVESLDDIGITTEGFAVHLTMN